MMTFKTPISPSLFFFFYLVLLHAAKANRDPCATATCRSDGPPIRFPFGLKSHHPQSCGYPGFDLSCDHNNETTIKLPFWGVLKVQAIDYAAQEIWINDPNNCLPQRILSLNLSGTPFVGIYERSFTFFNCSTTDYLRYRPLNPIACLSGKNGTVFATSSARVVRALSNSCRLVKTAEKVPVEWPFYEQILSSDLSEDLWLTWKLPMCRRCDLRGGRCGLKTNSSWEIACHRAHNPGIPRTLRYAIAIGAGIPGSICLLALFGFLHSKISSCVHRLRPHPQLPDSNPTVEMRNCVISGLDESTINSYPKIVLGESKRLPKQDHGTCSICLSEYNPKETLKTIPQCQHCFHSDCIDEWLRLNPTCPICRNSPEKSGPRDAPSL